MNHVGVPRVVPADPHGAVVEVHVNGVLRGCSQGEVDRSLGPFELRCAVQAAARGLQNADTYIRGMYSMLTRITHERRCGGGGFVMKNIEVGFGLIRAFLHKHEKRLGAGLFKKIKKGGGGLARDDTGDSKAFAGGRKPPSSERSETIHTHDY